MMMKHKTNKKEEEKEATNTPRRRREEEEKNKIKKEMEDERVEGAAVLPMDSSTIISTINIPPIIHNIKVTTVSTLALPSLTLSVAPSSLKQTHPPATVTQCLPDTPTSSPRISKGATAKKQPPTPFIQPPTPLQVASPPSQTPILPPFTKTLEPKYIVGGSTGLFSKDKEKDWRRSLFGGQGREGKDGSTPSSSGSSDEKSVERGTG